MPSTLTTLFKASRPPFLILTPVVIFLGYCSARLSSDELVFSDILLVFIAGLAAHISVNTLNEYLDFRSGLDLQTQRTPFSGGSGALPANPDAATAVLWFGIASLLTTVTIGLYFVVLHGSVLLPLGIAGVLLIITYTRWLNTNPWLCLVAPGTGFGPLMIIGTHVVLTGEYAISALLISLVPFFMVNNLLLLNQYPDIEADRRSGRRHFPIAFGTVASTLAYGLFTLAALLTIVAGISLDMLPLLSLISLVPIAASLLVWRGARQHANHVPALLPYMGMNVATTLVTPVVLGVALLLAW